MLQPEQNRQRNLAPCNESRKNTNMFSSDSLTKTVTVSKSFAELREFYEPDRHVVTHCRAWAYPMARARGLAEHAFLELTIRDNAHITPEGRCSTVRLDWYEDGLVGLQYSSTDAMRSDTEHWHEASHIWNEVNQKVDDCMARSVFVGTVLDACEIRMRTPYSLLRNNCQHFTSFLLRAVRAYAVYQHLNSSDSLYNIINIARTEGQDKHLTEQLIEYELRTKLKRGRETGREVFQIGNCTVLDCPAGHMARRMENLLLWCVEHRRRFVVVCSCNIDAPRCSVRRLLSNAEIIDAHTGKTPEVFHNGLKISFQLLCREVADRMLNDIDILSYDLPHGVQLENSIKNRHGTRNIFWLSSRSAVKAKKFADLVIIQYENSLTDDIRATITECCDQMREVVLLRVLPDRRLLNQSLRQTVRGDMIAAGFGDIPHFFGVSIINKSNRFGSPFITEVATFSFVDVDRIVEYIYGIISGQATFNNVLLSRWMCKLLTDDEPC